MENKNAHDARILMLSPPEQIPRDSFSRKSSGPSLDIKMKGGFTPVGRNQAPLSPPISPESKNATPDDSTSVGTRDPILFDDLHLNPSPLFSTPDHSSRKRLVEDHVAARESSAFRAVSPPLNDEYWLALEFKSQVAKQFNANRRLWAQRERAQLREDNLLTNGGRRYTAIAPATKEDRRKQSVVRVPGSGINGGRVRGPPKVQGPKQIIRHHTPDRKVAREDKDFNALPDYSPPVSSLPSKPNSLKVEWKGGPLDLRSDPHRDLLHPDELLLASQLRLDGATYLTSKRRVFIKRIEAYRIGKEFRKTDAQQACKIDVNKASKLWEAFNKVGWLDQKWILRYVNNV